MCFFYNLLFKDLMIAALPLHTHEKHLGVVSMMTSAPPCHDVLVLMPRFFFPSRSPQLPLSLAYLMGLNLASQ